MFWRIVLAVVLFPLIVIGGVFMGIWMFVYSTIEFVLDTIYELTHPEPAPRGKNEK